MKTDQGFEFLSDVLVVDLLPQAFGLTGRILADLGAEVFRVERSTDPADSRWDRRWERGSWAWDLGKNVVDPTPNELVALMGRAGVILRLEAGQEAPTPPPHVLEVVISSFGEVGPRAGWLASDLGIAAASGNLWSTGDPDRAPVRCSAPLSLVQTGPEAAIAALFGLAQGTRGRVDVSMAESFAVANMGLSVSLGVAGRRGSRAGAMISGTREIWPCRDGWVSFGLRGGKARQGSLAYLANLAATNGDDRLVGMDWKEYNPNTASEELVSVATDVFGHLFASLTVADLVGLATEEKVLVAPILDAAAITQSAQLADRSFFVSSASGVKVPGSFVALRRPAGQWSRLGYSRAESSREAPTPREQRKRPFEGTRIVEFGSGVAGPLVGRYFAEQGATVIRVESTTRPDFLRIYGLGPANSDGLEGSPLFVWTNTGKLGVTLDLKNDAALDLARSLVRDSHAVVENFTTGTLERLGLGFDQLAQENPGLVMLSMGFHGQTGPRRAEAGFGALGSALSGYNYLTGWPDREPIGPAGTITDSLAPRFGVAALAAALLAQRRGAPAVYLDVSQVEATVFSLSPWIAATSEGEDWGREGNHSPFAVPHGLYPGAGDDRWVAIAAWTDREWELLRGVIDWHGPTLDTLEERAPHAEDIDAAIAAWTVTRQADESAEVLQALGVEAVPVADFCDMLSDATLSARGHFVPTTHEVLGSVLAERTGYRLAPDGGGYERSSPSLGRDNRLVFCELIGLTDEAFAEFEAMGAIC